jgi:putative hydrolase of the HAD superfamily
LKKASPCIQAVTFDVGGTLIECQPSVGHIYAEEAARFGFNGISPDVLNQRFADAWRAMKDFPHTRSQWSALVDETFRGLTAKLPSETFFARLFERFAEASAWRIYDDVLPTLQNLAARGLKLGLISNWDDRLRPLLHGLKLDHHFETIVISWEIGSPKPAEAIFAAAASRLRLPPGAILHVGDSQEMDVTGARAAGLQAALLRRGLSRAVAGEIRSLRELPDSIRYVEP